MRRLILPLAALAAAALLAAGASFATAPQGRLAVVAQISFGCPGPVREGTLGCNPWRPFRMARFAVVAVGLDGKPVPGSRRVYVASAKGRAVVLLAVGRYLLLPLAQPHARAGKSLPVSVHAGTTTTVVLRWQGYPQMV
jgi:hypothetical protein